MAESGEQPVYCENCGSEIGNVRHAIGMDVYCAACFRSKMESSRSVTPQRKSIISPFTGKEIPPDVIAKLKQMFADELQKRLDEMHQRGVEEREKSKPPFDTGVLRHGWFTGYAPGIPSYISPDFGYGNLTIEELIRIQLNGYPEEAE